MAESELQARVDAVRARLADAEQRTRLRIRMTKAQEVVGVRFGEDRKIGLREIAAMARGRAAKCAAAHGMAEFGRRHGLGCRMEVSGR